jgi:hypothetical protein
VIIEEHEDPQEHKKRRHRPSQDAHGNIDLTQLAKDVSHKWNNLDSQTRSDYFVKLQANKKFYHSELVVRPFIKQVAWSVIFTAEKSWNKKGKEAKKGQQPINREEEASATPSMASSASTSIQ